MYDFQIPPNYDAIRCTIMRRVKEQREKKTRSLLPPPQRCPADNGLPSPPVEAYEPSSEDKVVVDLLPAQNTPLTVDPGTPDTAVSSKPELDEATIRQKLQQLEKEKHELFQLMKQLLSKEEEEKRPPSPCTPSPEPQPQPQLDPQPQPPRASAQHDHQPQPQPQPQRPHSLSRPPTTRSRSSDYRPRYSERRPRPPRPLSPFRYHSRSYRPYPSPYSAPPLSYPPPMSYPSRRSHSYYRSQSPPPPPFRYARPFPDRHIPRY